MQRVKLTSIPVSRNWTFGKEGQEKGSCTNHDIDFMTDFQMFYF